MTNDEIKAAEQAVQDAKQDLAVFKQRVLDGDTSITATMLAERQGAIDFAELQVEAAQRRAAQRAEADLNAELDAVRSDAEAILATGTNEFAEAFQTAVRAMDAAVRVMAARRGAILALRQRYEAALSRVGATDPSGTVQDGQRVRGVVVSRDAVRLFEGDRRQITAMPDEDVASAVFTAATAGIMRTGDRATEDRAALKDLIDATPELHELLTAALPERMHNLPQWFHQTNDQFMGMVREALISEAE
ncbi:hypothetical protein [Saccharothrix deserti]|uniref:hypothetical protein n=1 Tax=Saccharothrix deserti TaxID=2593674 RepID=UPI00131AD196|nr:hypothetical protein [Saccharothrix deserti]